MLSREENELLTRTGPATPAGDLLRRYWQPVALSEEIPLRGAPIPVRVLGEDLALFRDDSGRLGLLGLHCAHRGADLSYGRVEGSGLRCLYHGWLYDVAGSCLDQPGEPKDSDFKTRIHHTAYPCRELADLVFAYLGPGDPPGLPSYELLGATEAFRYRPIKNLVECNYLQANEGNFDPVHTSFLHRLADARPGSHDRLYASDVSPIVELEDTEFGLRIYALRKLDEERSYLRITNFLMPNACAIAGGSAADGYQIDWHVPMDDTHHWKYTLGFVRSAPLAERDRGPLRNELTADYRRKRNRANRYLQDRAELENGSFTGMGKVFQVHDAFATESPGPVQDRMAEHLGYTDKAIIRTRQIMLNAIRDVQEGRDIPQPVRLEDASEIPGLVVKAEVVQRSVDWRVQPQHMERQRVSGGTASE